MHNKSAPISSAPDDSEAHEAGWDDRPSTESRAPAATPTGAAVAPNTPANGVTVHSDPPPGTSWVLGPSSTTPPAPRASSPPAAFTLGGLGQRSLSRTITPRGVLAPGSQFGVYQVGACIGEGGMARIYQAEHAGLQRQVALKVLIDGVARGEESRERFLREARIAAAIKHPNVVNIFDVGVHEDTAYLVMELLSGTDLESLIASKGALDEGLIVDIMIPVAAGLAAVHDAGIVHRDLKPGNIFLSNGRYDDIEPKLLDFGISKAPGPEQMRLTTNGLLIGTPFYMSPEGLRGEEMTPLSDQYSLGVVMYECATGTNPFSAQTFAEIFKLIGAASYPAPSSVRPLISKRLERIILRAMSLDPNERFKDLREMGRELLQLAGQRTRVTWALSFGEVPRKTLNSAERPPVGGFHPPKSSPPPSNKRKKLVALVPLLALVAAVALWLIIKPAPPAGSVQAAVPAHAEHHEPVKAPAATAPPAAPSSADVRIAAESAEPAEQAAPGRPKRRVSTRRVSGADGADPDLEWALPSSAAAPPKPVQARTGSNGAPIFD